MDTGILGIFEKNQHLSLSRQTHTLQGYFHNNIYFRNDMLGLFWKYNFTEPAAGPVNCSLGL